LAFRKACGSAGGSGASQVAQVSALAGIVLVLGLLREVDGALPVCESTAGGMIDKAGHVGAIVLAA